MAEVIYVLCAVTSVVCAVLLQRQYAKTGTTLLAWSAVCFAGLALAFPNLLSERTRESLPSWLPHKAVNLGLDLRGGSYLLLEVDHDTPATVMAAYPQLRPVTSFTNERGDEVRVYLHE